MSEPAGRTRPKTTGYTRSTEAGTMTCRFCALSRAPQGRWFGSVFAVPDAYPVTPGHWLIIPVRHRTGYFDLTPYERDDTHRALLTLAADSAAFDFNIGWNVGPLAGQTVMHAHCHLIPRREGDIDDPTGGVRGVIPDRRIYERSDRC